MTRHLQEGFEPVVVPDGRRGIWQRVTHGEGRRVTRLELCAGRDGDDQELVLVAGDVVTADQLFALHDSLARVRWSDELRESSLESAERAAAVLITLLRQLLDHAESPRERELHDGVRRVLHAYDGRACGVCKGRGWIVGVYEPRLKCSRCSLAALPPVDDAHRFSAVVGGRAHLLAPRQVLLHSATYLRISGGVDEVAEALGRTSLAPYSQGYLLQSFSLVDHTEGVTYGACHVGSVSVRPESFTVSYVSRWPTVASDEGAKQESGPHGKTPPAPQPGDDNER
ncbi:hypothetical protein [Chondromyces apiculatus]|uniref:Uncharacterized protein n=1 Tax=Chondromyces apiculatus DSM 436 TaxID=1192034 RepID=A0A017TDV8_9BACT|nr:hypothetical protein [Chondromyces apiculatus]EYF07067.1 Hypothetical protein CAP_1326 [Chondromyces apiculatus DSM 436]